MLGNLANVSIEGSSAKIKGRFIASIFVIHTSNSCGLKYSNNWSKVRNFIHGISVKMMETLVKTWRNTKN